MTSIAVSDGVSHAWSVGCVVDYSRRAASGERPLVIGFLLRTPVLGTTTNMIKFPNALVSKA